MLVPVSCFVVLSVIDAMVFAGEASEPKKAVKKEKALAWKIVLVLPKLCRESSPGHSFQLCA